MKYLLVLLLLRQTTAVIDESSSSVSQVVNTALWNKIIYFQKGYIDFIKPGFSQIEKGCFFNLPALEVGSRVQLSRQAQSDADMSPREPVKIKLSINQDFSILVQISSERVILTKVQGYEYLSVVSELKNIVDSVAITMESFVILSDRLLKRVLFQFNSGEDYEKLFWVATINNAQKQISLVQCYYLTLKCTLRSQGSVPYPGSKLIPAFEGVYVDYPMISELGLLSYQDLRQVGIVKYPSKFLYVDTLQGMWVGAKKNSFYKLSKSGGFLKEEAELNLAKILRKKPSEIIGLSTSENYIICALRMQKSVLLNNLATLLIIMPQKSPKVNEWISNPIEGTTTDIDNNFEWKNTLVFSNKGDFKVFKVPEVDIPEDDDPSQYIFNYDYTLNSTFYIDNQQIFAAVPNSDNINSMGIISYYADNLATFNFNQLEIGPLELDCQKSQSASLVDTKLNFVVQYDNLSFVYTVIHYTVEFIYSNNILDWKLLVVLGIVALSIVLFSVFVYYKLQLVRNSRRELKKVLVEQERITVKRESRRRLYSDTGYLTEQEQSSKGTIRLDDNSEITKNQKLGF